MFKNEKIEDDILTKAVKKVVPNNIDLEKYSIVDCAHNRFLKEEFNSIEDFFNEKLFTKVFGQSLYLQ